MTDEFELPSLKMGDIHVEGLKDLVKADETIASLESRIEELESDLIDANSSAEELRNTISGLKEAKGIDILEEKLAQFKRTASLAVEEFNAFLVSAKLDDIDGSYADRFSDIARRIREGFITLSQGIVEAKARVGEFAESTESIGGSFDATAIQTITASLSGLSKMLDTVLKKLENFEVNGIGSGGGGSGGGGGGGNLVDTIHAVQEAAHAMSDEAKDSLNQIENLAQTLQNYASIDTRSLLAVSNAFQGIANIGSGRYGTKSIQNIINLASALSRISQSGINSLSFNLDGIKDLKVSKASLEALATYLPQIAAVDSANLKSIADISWENIKNLKISGKQLENLTRLIEIAGTLQRYEGTLRRSLEELNTPEGGGGQQPLRERADELERIASIMSGIDRNQGTQVYDALLGIGADGGFANRVSEDLVKLEGNIKTVKVRWREFGEDGAHIASVTANAVNSVGQEFSRTIDYVREFNDETEEMEWVQQQSGAATIKIDQAEIKKFNEYLDGVKEYKKLLGEALSTNGVVYRDEDGIWKSRQEGYDALTRSLNETHEQIARVTADSERESITLEHQTRVTRELTDVEEDYNRQLNNQQSKNALSEARKQQAKEETDQIKKQREEYQKAIDAISKYQTAQINAIKGGLTQDSNGVWSGADKELAEVANRRRLAVEELTSAEKRKQLTDEQSANIDKKLKEAEENVYMATKKKAESAVSAEAAQKSYSRALAAGEKALRNWGAAENSVHKSSRDAYQDIKNSVDNLRQVSDAQKRGTKTAEDLANASERVHSAIKQAEPTLRQNGDLTRTWSDRLSDVAKRFSAYFSVSQIIMSSVRYMRQLVSNAIELETAFTRLQIVTGATNKEMESFSETAVQLSKNLGQSVVDVTKSIETFSRLGYNLEEASELANYAQILSNVAGTSSEEATTGITSIIKGFNMNVENTEHVADVLIQVGQKYAVSASELMTAFEKSGAALNATNTTFEKSAGLIAAANASVQNANTVGTALKTVSARIRGSKTDLEELGESVDDLADGFSKYAKEIQALTGFNIMVEGTTNEFKDLYDIMAGISAVWDDLSDTQQARVSEILGGTRQLQVISSIIGNWKDAVGAYSDAMGAAGVATNANSKYMETAQAKINQMKATFQELSTTVFNGGLISDLASFGTNILSLANDAAKLMNVMGGLKTSIIAVLGVIATIKAEAIVNFFRNIQTHARNASDTIQVYYEVFREGMKKAAQDGSNWIGQIKAGFESIRTASSDATAAIGLFTLAMTAGFAIFNGIQQAQQKYADGLRETYTNSIESAQAVSSLYDTYEDYYVVINDNTASKKTLEEATNNLAEALGREREAAELTQDALKNLTQVELTKGINDAKAALAALAEEAKSEFNVEGNTPWGIYKLLNMDSAKANALVDIISPIANKYKDIEDPAKYLGKLSAAYDDLKRKRDELIRAGEYGDELNNVSQAINILSGYVEKYGTTIDLLDQYTNQFNTVTKDQFDIANEASKNVDTVTAKMQQLADAYNNLVNGNLDYSKRKFVSPLDMIAAGWKDFNGDVATTFSQGETIGEGKNTFTISITPILEDGTVLSPDALRRYIDNLITDSGIDGLLASDSHNLIIDVQQGEYDENYWLPLEDKLDEIKQKHTELAQSIGMLPEQAGAAELKLSDIFSRYKQAIDLITKAQNDMRDGSGLSVETISAFESAGLDLNKFLYEENGLLKANIDALRYYSTAGLSGMISNTQQSIAVLEEENRELSKRASLLLEQNYSEDGSDRVGGGFVENAAGISAEIEEITGQIDRNNVEIEKNQALLRMYESIFGNLSDSMSLIDPFSLTEMFSGLDTAASGIDKVVSAMEKLADGTAIAKNEMLALIEQYPALLEQADLFANGNVEAQKSALNAILDMQEQEYDAEIDKKIAELDATEQLLNDQLELESQKAAILDEIENMSVNGKLDQEEELTEKIAELNDLQGQNFVTFKDGELKVNKEDLDKQLDQGEEFGEKAADSIWEPYAQTVVSAHSEGYSKSLSTTNSFLSKLWSNIKSKLRSIASNVATAWTKMWSGDLAGAWSALTGNVSSVGGDTSVSSGTVSVSWKGGTATVGEQSVDEWVSEQRDALNKRVELVNDAIKKTVNAKRNLEALKGLSLRDIYASTVGSGGGGGGGGSSKSSNTSDKSSSDKEEKENIFKQMYDYHKHLVAMEQETEAEFLDWLNDAYKEAYKENEITLEEYRKYEEEVFKGLRDLFKDYLSDKEHEISMRENFEGETKKIISLYEEMMAAIEKEIADARARGLTDEDDYIQELQSKYVGYSDAIKKIREDIEKNAKDATKKLVDYRVQMLKQDIQNEREALSERRKLLQEFYNKQKEMLQDQNDEETYYKEQAEKRKKITDIQLQLTQLERDDSAAAEKKKLELRQQLVDAQEELSEFERQHALEMAQEQLDNLYEMQDKELEAQENLLEEKENDTKALYEQALEDIKNGSIELYEEMIEWNNTYGDGIEDTITTAWEDAYKALKDYRDLYGTPFEGYDLANATGYKSEKGTWADQKISKPVEKKAPNSGTTVTSGGSRSTSAASSGTGSGTGSGASSGAKSGTSSASAISDDVKRKVAAAIWNKATASGWGHNPERARRLEEVFGKNNGIQALINQGVGKMDPYPGNEYSYLAMRKKYKGYASGTGSASSGLHRIDELGTETIFQSADGSRYKMFTGGEKVLNAKASDFLYNFANRGSELFGSMFGGLSGGFGGINRAGLTPSIVMGDIIIQGNADKSTVSEIRRAQRESVEMMLKEFNRLSK